VNDDQSIADPSAWAAGPPLSRRLMLEIEQALEMVSGLLELERQVVDDQATATAMVSSALAAVDAALETGRGDPEPEHGLLHASRALHRVDRQLLELRLQRRSEVLATVSGVLPRLQAAATSVPELVTVAPELICELGFDRGMISRVQDNVWYPELVFVMGGDPTWAERIPEAGNTRPSAITTPMPEVEVVRDRRPILVTGVRDPSRPRWGHQAMILASGTRSYVAAPIVSGNHVIGMFHADCLVQRRDVDAVDRDLLGAFAESFQLVLARAALNDRLAATQRRLGQLSMALQDASVALDEIPVVRALRDTGETAHNLLVRVGPRSDAQDLPDTLTSRELEVLGLMAAGCTNTAIAHRLTIADGTAKKHVLHILRKLEAANRSEAVARWFRAGGRVQTDERAPHP